MLGKFKFLDWERPTLLFLWSNKIIVIPITIYKSMSKVEQKWKSDSMILFDFYWGQFNVTIDYNEVKLVVIKMAKVGYFKEVGNVVAGRYRSAANAIAIIFFYVFYFILFLLFYIFWATSLRHRSP